MASDSISPIRPIVTRAQAVALGLKRYFTGKQCRRGHVAERFVAGGECRECERENKYRYHEQRIADKLARTPPQFGFGLDKECYVCRRMKPLVEFAKANTCTSGYRNECRECSNKRVAAWKRANRVPKLRQRKPKKPYDPVRERAKVIRAKYKITSADYDRLFQLQGGVCALCRVRSQSIRGTRLSVDHCHETNRIRGLLCTNCNTAIGMLGDNATGLQRALDYVNGKLPIAEEAQQDKEIRSA